MASLLPNLSVKTVTSPLRFKGKDIDLDLDGGTVKEF